MDSLPMEVTSTMVSLPREVKIIILGLLDDENDRDALATAYPSWKDSVEYDDSFRTVKVDPSGVHRMPLNDFLDRFNESNIRQWQLLRDVKVGFHLEQNPSGCWLDAHRDQDRFDRRQLTNGILEVLDALQQLENRVKASEHTRASPIRLSFNTCTELPFCNVTNCEVLRERLVCDSSLMFRQPLSLSLHEQPKVLSSGRRPTLYNLQSVHEFVFKNRELLRYVDPTNIVALTWRMSQLRRLRLEFDEDELWETKSKDNWRNSICYAVTSNAPRRGTPLLEEVHIHIGRHSVRDDTNLRQLQTPEHWWSHHYHAESVMLALSQFSSLTVLNLTGQFCLSPSAFDRFPSINGALMPPFPALRSFRLEFGPDSTQGRWFFVPEKQSSDRPVPPPLQQRTRPNNETINTLLKSAANRVAKTPKIKTFSLCLRDKFYFEVTKRTLEVHFVMKNEDHGGHPTLTFKLGDKVNTWRLAGDALKAWTAAAGGKQSGLKILFEE